MLIVDKNPHPDAKEAFDALQDAYDSISSPSRREEYDQEIMRKMRIQKARRWNARRIRKWVDDTVTNWHSSFLLFHHEITHMEGIPGKVSVSQSMALLWKKINSAAEAMWIKATECALLQVEHYTLLPTTLDRFKLLNEQLWRNKVKVVVGMLVSIFFLRRK